MSEKYVLKLDRFEGPLDLLLHLIRVNELSIFEIDLLLITAQYLEYLRIIKFSDIKEAAAFIEMAASLIEIKSRRLIPTNKDSDKQNEELLGEDDTEEALKNRLMLYDQFRAAGEHFSRLTTLNDASYACSEPKRLSSFYEDQEKPLEGDHLTLLILYEQMLASLGDKIPSRVSLVKEAIPLDEILKKMNQYIDRLQVLLFEKLYHEIDSRYELVAYILAVLQLVRDRQAKIIQENLLGPLWVCSHDLDRDMIDEKILTLT